MTKTTNIARQPGDVGEIWEREKVLFHATSTGHAPGYLFSFRVCAALVAEGLLIVRRVISSEAGDFTVFGITEAGRMAFSRQAA